MLTGQVEEYMQTCHRKSKQVTKVRDDSCEACQNRTFVAHKEVGVWYLYLLVKMDQAIDSDCLTVCQIKFKLTLLTWI